MKHMSPIKSNPLATRKAPLRKYVEENRKALAGRKTKPTLRVYTNGAGETFTLKRTYSGFNKRGQKEKSFEVIVEEKLNGHFATATIEVSSRTQVSNIEGREIYIQDVGIHNYHYNPKGKSGCGVFGMILDECMQLGKKEFGKKPYYITLQANNEKTAQYYHSFGFEFVSLKPIKMKLQVN
jgi:hypothetical protein